MLEVLDKDSEDFRREDDPLILIRRVLERERFCKDVGDGALSEMILSVVEPIIRADEREREWEAMRKRSYIGRYQHAEAVAARLVEVICEDAALRGAR